METTGPASSRGYFTPLAAQNAAWAVAHLTPQESETMFARMGGMNPSKSTLDRLPKGLSERWEASRTKFEAAVRAEEQVPPEAVSVGVSLDGVLVPMKDGERQEKRAASRAEGRQTKGPAGYHEASCGTLTLYDRDGQPLRTIRVARMPEKNKATLKTQLTAELERLLALAPELRVVPVADGVKDNWSFLSRLPWHAYRRPGGRLLARGRAPSRRDGGGAWRRQHDVRGRVREVPPHPAA